MVMLGYSILGLKNVKHSGKQYACKLITKFFWKFFLNSPDISQFSKLFNIRFRE